MRNTHYISKLFFMATLLSVMATTPVHSQDTLGVRTSTAHMSKGSQPVYIVDIPMAVLKDVQQAWIKRLQEGVRVKVAESSGELILADVVKPEIVSDTVTLYSLLIEKEGKVILNVFLEIDSVFFSMDENNKLLATEKTDHALKNYLRRFAVEQYREAAGLKLETEEKLLRDKQNEYDKLVKEEDNLKKENNNLESEIEKTERSVASLDQEIEMKNQELLGHRSAMGALVLEPDKKAAQEKDKTLEKEKNKLEKERQKSKNDISDMKSKIEKNEGEIEKLEKDQQSKLEEIETQKEAVSKAQAFLDGIK